MTWFVDGKEHCAIKFWFSSKSSAILPLFEEVLVNVGFLVDFSSIAKP